MWSHLAEKTIEGSKRSHQGFDSPSSNIHVAQIPVFHARTKHIEVHYHFMQERVQSGDIDLQHINTNFQVAKALGVDKLRQFMSDLVLMITALPSLRGSTTQRSVNQLIETDQRGVKDEGEQLKPTDHSDTGSRNSKSRNKPNNKTTFRRSKVWRGVLRVKPNFPNAMAFTLATNTLGLG